MPVQNSVISVIILFFDTLQSPSHEFIFSSRNLMRESQFDLVMCHSLAIHKSKGSIKMRTFIFVKFLLCLFRIYRSNQNRHAQLIKHLWDRQSHLEFANQNLSYDKQNIAARGVSLILILSNRSRERKKLLIRLVYRLRGCSHNSINYIVL